MGATIVRQWLVLSMLPRPPRRVETATIERALRERGIPIHRRTIQRDLLELSEVFPIVADERTKPYGWRWSEETDPQERLPLLACVATGPRLAISLRVRARALEALLAKLGARDLRFVPAPSLDALVSVTATVDDSDRTRRLLLGHADEVEVVAPPHLREQVAERARRAAMAHAT